MKKALLTLLISCIAITASLAATNITSPTVSGHWTTAGSPYYIFNAVEINTGQSLIIDPGVQVFFKVNGSIIVWGSLKAEGTALAPILFDVADTTGWHIDTQNTYDGAWKGIYFGKYTAPTDISVLAYCNFRHCKYTGIAVDRSLYVHHCNFTDMKGKCLSLLGNKPGSYEVSHCNFYNNTSTLGAVLNIVSHKAAWYVHDNNLYNNSGYIVNCDTSTLLFSHNNVYNNTGTTGMIKLWGFYATPCYVVMDGNRIYNNQGTKGAVIYSNYTLADICNNYIANNYHLESANCALIDGGGAMYLMGNGDYNDQYPGYGIPCLYTVRNNVIANNYSAIYGGGIGLYNAKALIANNTIVNNKAPRGGGIDIFTVCTITVCIRNNILWGNVNEQGNPGNISLWNTTKVNIKYDYNWTTSSFSTDVFQPGMPRYPIDILGDTTTNIIGINPGIVLPTLTANYTESALASNFGLSAISACIDKGTNAAVPNNGQVDYAGNNRISGNAVDIGAYEYSSSTGTNGPLLQADSIYKNCCAVIPPMVAGVQATSPLSAETINIYPNPASSIVFIATPKESGQISVNDVMGRQVMVKQVTGSLTLFEIHALPRGAYYITWTGDNTISKKIILE